MEYKVGDKVRVRGDLEADSFYGGALFTPGMKKYSGKTMTVDKIINTNRYGLKEDTSYYYWSEEMLEDVEGITILVKDNKVIAKIGNKVGIAKCSPEDEFDIFTGARLALKRLEKECKPYSWLKNGVRYYYPRVDKDDLFAFYYYTNDKADERLINRGLVFKTKEEAINCAKKMLEIVK